MIYVRLIIIPHYALAHRIGSPSRMNRSGRDRYRRGWARARRSRRRCLRELADQIRDQSGPTGLMRRAAAAAGVAVKYSWNRMLSLKCGSVWNFS